MDAEFEARALTGRIPSVGDTNRPTNGCLAPLVTLRALVPRGSKSLTMVNGTFDDLSLKVGLHRPR